MGGGGGLESSNSSKPQDLFSYPIAVSSYIAEIAKIKITYTEVHFLCGCWQQLLDIVALMTPSHSLELTS
jgi:hypothetical protein